MNQILLLILAIAELALATAASNAAKSRESSSSAERLNQLRAERQQELAQVKLERLLQTVNCPNQKSVRFFINFDASNTIVGQSDYLTDEVNGVNNVLTAVRTTEISFAAFANGATLLLNRAPFDTNSQSVINGVIASGNVHYWGYGTQPQKGLADLIPIFPAANPQFVDFFLTVSDFDVNTGSVAATVSGYSSVASNNPNIIRACAAVGDSAVLSMANTLCGSNVVQIPTADIANFAQRLLDQFGSILCPSSAPTIAITVAPTVQPTTEKPTSSSPTFKPSFRPSTNPTHVGQTYSPSTAPSKENTTAPTMADIPLVQQNSTSPTLSPTVNGTVPNIPRERQDEPYCPNPNESLENAIKFYLMCVLISARLRYGYNAVETPVVAQNALGQNSPAVTSLSSVIARNRELTGRDARPNYAHDGGGQHIEENTELHETYGLPLTSLPSRTYKQTQRKWKSAFGTYQLNTGEAPVQTVRTQPATSTPATNTNSNAASLADWIPDLLVSVYPVQIPAVLWHLAVYLKTMPLNPRTRATLRDSDWNRIYTRIAEASDVWTVPYINGCTTVEINGREVKVPNVAWTNCPALEANVTALVKKCFTPVYNCSQNTSCCAKGVTNPTTTNNADVTLAPTINTEDAYTEQTVRTQPLNPVLFSELNKSLAQQRSQAGQNNGGIAAPPGLGAPSVDNTPWLKATNANV